MNARSVEKRHIMYVCHGCYENDPESCGHFDRDELRVTADDQWLCDSCYEYDQATDPDKSWSDLAIPPEYKPL
jgi:hypothetical protein